MMINIMLDLETWGKKPGCDIRSIGACVFDYKTGVVYDGGSHQHGNTEPFYITCDNPETGVGAGCWVGKGEWRKYALIRDPETVAWWNDQSDEAKGAFINPVDLRDALVKFSYWLDELCAPVSQRPVHGHNVPIWAHGPTFDVSILAAAYDAVGLPVPWHYRAPRDTRTLFDIADIHDHSGFMGMYNHGTAHHALDDAIAQAKAVCGAYKVLRSDLTIATP